MTSQDEQAFLTAIFAEPDDDTPRLVFADWLDERGQGDDAARAALIRAQCQAEVLPPKSKERAKLERQARAILKEHGDRWAKELRDSRLVRDWQFRRGFLDGVTMSASVFARSAEKLFEIAPTIRTAYFPDASNEVGRLAKCEFLARLASVDLHHMCKCGFCPIQNDLRALFGSKHTRGLTALNIANDRMDAEGAKRLASSPGLARLTSLDLSNNPLGAEGVAALGKSKHLSRLAALNLSRTGLGAAGMESLAKLKNLPALRRLALAGNRVTADALRAFVASPLFAQLTSLDLSKNPFGTSGAQVLAAAPAGARLEALDVRNCKVAEKGARALRKRFGKGVKV
jgi:uncharacterized protein (TIGR02996 family)